jgi:hypothetical protein
MTDWVQDKPDTELRSSVELSLSPAIEPSIRPLVNSLNIRDVSLTIGSCEGHLQFFRVRGPYVYFKASTQFASLFNDAIRTDLCADTPALNYPWHLYGIFNECGELCFRLAVPRFDHHPLLSRLMWSRPKLDSDFSTLRWLAEIACTKVGKNPMPKVKHEPQRKEKWCNAQQKEVTDIPASFFLLPAQFACRMGGPALRAVFRRGANSISAFSARYQSHSTSSSKVNDGVNAGDATLIYTGTAVLAI